MSARVFSLQAARVHAYHSCSRTFFAFGDCKEAPNPCHMHAIALIHAACRVFVLDGGLPAWKAAGQPIEDGEVAVEVLQAATRAAGAPPAGGSTYVASKDASKVSSKCVQGTWAQS